jgi:hypothetical protein
MSDSFFVVREENGVEVVKQVCFGFFYVVIIVIIILFAVRRFEYIVPGLRMRSLRFSSLRWAYHVAVFALFTGLVKLSVLQKDWPRVLK